MVNIFVSEKVATLKSEIPLVEAFSALCHFCCLHFLDSRLYFSSCWKTPHQKLLSLFWFIGIQKKWLELEHV